MGRQTVLSRSRGANDQAQRCEGSAAVPDVGAASPDRVGVREHTRARSRGPALPNQCSDDSSVAEALAEQWRRRVGAVLSSAPAAPGAARGYRADPPRPPGAWLRGRSYASLVATCAWDPARHGHDSTGVSGHRDAPPAPDPQAGTPPNEAVRKGGTGRVGAGRREVRADRGPLGVSVHRPGRLYALPRPAAVPTSASRLESRVPHCAPARLPLPP